ncbi:glycosyltransferase family 2 protein [Methanobacterium sp. MBAC-LM]|uniref:glycosyltransferase family 2 protein n=1 Tax=Methanobacterium sp. MBAC-LM TaxID=3412034 RepID=UPI003C73D23C
MPVVSVIMPSYNHEKFIPEAIESVLGQTFRDLELIIIDDKSGDNSQQIIDEFAQKDNRIKKIFHRENLGIAKTINEGIKNSTGKYIALIASDDMWIREKLEKQLKILEADENLVVWCNSAIIDSNSNLTGEITSEKYKNATPHGYVFEEIVNSWISGSGIIIKRENIQDMRYSENLKYLNDTQFYADLAYRYQFYYMVEALSKYRLHGDNASFGEITDIKGWYHDSLVLCIYLFQEYGSGLSYKALKNIFYKTCIVPFMIGTQNDALNKFNIIYPVVTPLTFMLLTIKTIPKRITGKIAK